MNLQQVHLRINDAATGMPTPVRLRITDAEGTYYAPYGRLTEFATGVNQDVGGNVMIGSKRWAYIDGTCEILLPPGTLRIEIAKGPEYKPIDEEIHLLAGKMALRFEVDRWSDVRKQGWFSGDTRVHFLSPDAALLEGQAEDVAVVNLLACETEITDQFGQRQEAIPNILSFSGQSFACQAGGCGVAVNTHNRHPELGSLGLLHCHRVVYPLTFKSPDWTLDDWCGQCHRKNGLVVWTDPQHQTADFLYGEPLADLILGNVDAFELTFFEDSPFDALADYYKLLNAGLHLPLVGASGKETNGTPLGVMRTYAWLPAGQEFSYAAWIEAVRAGRTFVSNGPLLRFTIAGQGPGANVDDELERKLNRSMAELERSVRETTSLASGIPAGELRESIAGPTNLRLWAEARSWGAFDRLEWLWNGEPIATAHPAGSSPCQAVLEHELVVKESGWLAVRCQGQTLLPGRPAPQRIFAHSSPIPLKHGDRPFEPRADAVRALLGELENMTRWAHGKNHARLLRVLEDARTALAQTCRH